MNQRFTPSSWLFLAFGVVALAFTASTAYVHTESLGIDAQTGALVDNALPSIERLDVAAGDVQLIEMAADVYSEDPGGRAAAREQIERRWEEIDRELAAYRALPTYPGEQELYQGSVPVTLRALDAAIARLFARVEGGAPAPACEAAVRDVRRTAGSAADRLRQLKMLNTTHVREHVHDIERVRRRTSAIALILDGVALLIGAAAVLGVRRVFKARARLEEDHRALVEQRAAELELFGTRVAHDLLSPLTALTYCLGTFKRAAEHDPPLGQALVRARGCVSRAQRMVDSIFEFARAGGKPAEGARADVREVADQVAAELEVADLRDRPSIEIDPFPPIAVRCASGVLSSLLANLMGNAAKYMSDSAVRRITVRAEEVKDLVRIEVEDTGPGVPPGLEQAIFEPYVRAAGATQAGLGLGLATVRRLCAAHGGEAGVRSTPGRGSVFWITLPRAEPEAKIEAPESHRAIRRAV